MAVITMIILLLLLPISQYLIHLLKPVGIHISIAKFDLGCGISMSFI